MSASVEIGRARIDSAGLRVLMCSDEIAEWCEAVAKKTAEPIDERITYGMHSPTRRTNVIGYSKRLPKTHIGVVRVIGFNKSSKAKGGPLAWVAKHGMM